MSRARARAYTCVHLFFPSRFFRALAFRAHKNALLSGSSAFSPPPRDMIMTRAQLRAICRTYRREHRATAARIRARCTVHGAPCAQPTAGVSLTGRDAHSSAWIPLGESLERSRRSERERSVPMGNNRAHDNQRHAISMYPINCGLASIVFVCRRQFRISRTPRRHDDEVLSAVCLSARFRADSALCGFSARA